MLIAIETANPPFKVSQTKATEELKKRMAVRPAVGRLIDAASANSGIESRYFVVPDGDDSAENKFFSNESGYIKPDTQTRMLEYEQWSKSLTAQAVKNLLEKNNVEPAKIGRLITISCTGFFAPGLDYHLINECNLPKDTKRTHIGFMGCAASLVGFNSVFEAANQSDLNGKYTLLVSVELCSLHLQTEATRDNILANIIFADGCAVALFSNDSEIEKENQLEIISTKSILFDDSSQFMGWKIGNYGFEMMLSSELPKIIEEIAAPKLMGILKDLNISPKEIKHWALHPGGRAILDSIQKGIGLSDEEMVPSRIVLNNYGNMSSASILFVLKELIESNKIQTGEYCCAVAFGPGLTMEVALLRKN